MIKNHRPYKEKGCRQSREWKWHTVTLDNKGKWRDLEINTFKTCKEIKVETENTEQELDSRKTSRSV